MSHELGAYNPEAIDTLERLIQACEDDRAAGATATYSVTLKAGRGKKSWIPRGIGQILSNGYEHVALLVGTVRRRERRIRELEAEVARLAALTEPERAALLAVYDAVGDLDREALRDCYGTDTGTALDVALVDLWNAAGGVDDSAEVGRG